MSLIIPDKVFNASGPLIRYRYRLPPSPYQLSNALSKALALDLKYLFRYLDYT